MFRHLLLATLVSSLLGFTPAQAATYDEALRHFHEWGTGSKAENGGFLLTHARKTAKVALLMHGLTDSPYFVRSIGETLHAQGWNVVGVLLTGHGDKPEALQNVQAEEWISDLSAGIEMAQGLGDEVIVGGFSMGAALGIYSALYPSKFVVAPHALLLFSPAVAFADGKAGLSCWAKMLQTWAIGGLPEDERFRYRNVATNGVCQVSRLMKMIGHEKSAAQIEIPVFVASSAADHIIDPAAMRRFATALKGPHDFLEFPAADKLDHSAVMVRALNPRYEELQTRLVEFIHGLD